MNLSCFWDVTGPGLAIAALALTVGAIATLFFLIVLVESVVLQVMRWGNFRGALLASFLMNLASSLAGITLLFLLPRFGWLGLGLAWALSVLIEGLALIGLRRNEQRLNWLASLAANTASYLILLAPAYLSAR